MKVRQKTVLVSYFLCVVQLSGCTASSTKVSKVFDFASTATIVKNATPAGLKSTSSANLRIKQVLEKFAGLSFLSRALAANAAVADVKTSLTGMFKGTYGKISGGSGTGYINSNLEDLDSRVDELEGRFTTLPTCFSGTLTDLAVDFSVHADANLTLKVNCRDEFTWTSGDAGAPGSGMVFGRREKTDSLPELISLMLLLKHKTSIANGGSDSYDAGFGYAGTITGSGTDSEAVDMLFGQFNTKTGLATSDEDQPLIARIYAKPKTNEFELALTATTPSSGGPTSGGSTALGCGFRMISNGTLIVAKGNYVGSGTCVAGTKDTVDVCVDATTLADVSVSSSAECATLAAQQFHISSTSSSISTLTYTTLTADTVAASGSIYSALKPGSTAAKAATASVQ